MATAKQKAAARRNLAKARRVRSQNRRGASKSAGQGGGRKGSAKSSSRQNRMMEDVEE